MPNIHMIQDLVDRFGLPAGLEFVANRVSPFAIVTDSAVRGFHRMTLSEDLYHLWWAPFAAHCETEAERRWHLRVHFVTDAACCMRVHTDSFSRSERVSGNHRHDGTLLGGLYARVDALIEGVTYMALEEKAAEARARNEVGTAEADEQPL